MPWRLAQNKVMRLYLFVDDHCEAIALSDIRLPCAP
jgi:hypothetical protein